MLDFVKDYLSKLNIELVGAISLERCNIIRPYKLKDFATDDYSSLSAIMIAVPYLTKHEMQNITSSSSSSSMTSFQCLTNGIPMLVSKGLPITLRSMR